MSRIQVKSLPMRILPSGSSKKVVELMVTSGQLIYCMFPFGLVMSEEGKNRLQKSGGVTLEEMLF